MKEAQVNQDICSKSTVIQVIINPQNYYTFYSNKTIVLLTQAPAHIRTAVKSSGG